MVSRPAQQSLLPPEGQQPPPRLQHHQQKQQLEESPSLIPGGSSHPPEPVVLSVHTSLQAGVPESLQRQPRKASESLGLGLVQEEDKQELRAGEQFGGPVNLYRNPNNKDARQMVGPGSNCCAPYPRKSCWKKPKLGGAGSQPSCLRDENSSSCPPALLEYWTGTNGDSPNKPTRSTSSRISNTSNTSNTSSRGVSNNNNSDANTGCESNVREASRPRLDGNPIGLGIVGSWTGDLEPVFRGNTTKKPSNLAANQSSSEIPPPIPGRRRPVSVQMKTESRAAGIPISQLSPKADPMAPARATLRHESLSGGAMHGSDGLTTLVGFLVVTKETSIVLGQLGQFLDSEPHFPDRRTSLILATEQLSALLAEAARLYKAIKHKSIDPCIVLDLLRGLEAKIGLCSGDVQPLVHEMLQKHLAGLSLREADMYTIHAKICDHSFQIQKAIAQIKMFWSQVEHVGLQPAVCTLSSLRRSSSDAKGPSWRVVLSGRLDSLERSFQSFVSSEREPENAEGSTISADVTKIKDMTQCILTEQTAMASRSGNDAETLERRLNSIDNNMSSLATSIETLVDRIERDSRHLRPLLSPISSPPGGRLGRHSTSGADGKRKDKAKCLPTSIGSGTLKKDHIAAHSPIVLDKDEFPSRPLALSTDTALAGAGKKATEALLSPSRLDNPKTGRNSAAGRRKTKTIPSPMVSQTSDSFGSPAKRTQKGEGQWPIPTSKYGLKARHPANMSLNRASMASVSFGQGNRQSQGRFDRASSVGGGDQTGTGRRPGGRTADINKPLPSTFTKPTAKSQASSLVTRLSPETSYRRRLKKPSSLPTQSESLQSRTSTPAPPVPGPRHPKRLNSTQNTRSARRAHGPSQPLRTVPSMEALSSTPEPSKDDATGGNPSPEPKLKAPQPSVSFSLQRNTFSPQSLRLPRLTPVTSSTSNSSRQATSPHLGGEQDASSNTEQPSGAEEEINKLKDFGTSSSNVKAWQEMHSSSGLPDLKDLKEHMRIQEEWNYVIASTSRSSKLKMDTLDGEAILKSGNELNEPATTDASPGAMEGAYPGTLGDANGSASSKEKEGPRNTEIKVKEHSSPPGKRLPASVDIGTIPPASPACSSIYRAKCIPDIDIKPCEIGESGTKAYPLRKCNTSISSNTDNVSSSVKPRRDLGRSVSRRLVNSLYGLGTNFRLGDGHGSQLGGSGSAVQSQTLRQNLHHSLLFHSRSHATCREKCKEEFANAHESEEKTSGTSNIEGEAVAAAAADGLKGLKRAKTQGDVASGRISTNGSNAKDARDNGSGFGRGLAFYATAAASRIPKWSGASSTPKEVPPRRAQSSRSNYWDRMIERASDVRRKT